MSNYERGPAINYEVVWKTGHVDRFKAHQVTHRGGETFLFSFPGQQEPKPARIEFHGEFDGRWQLVLSASMDDILTVRNLTQCEDLA